MSDDTKKRLIEFIDSLIGEGNRLRKDARHQWVGSVENVFVESVGAGKFWSGCQQLIDMLGKRAAPWKRLAENERTSLQNTELRIGCLQTIKEAIERDLLLRVEDLVMAEAFDDLLGQAEYLFNEGYSLAAGVLGRAVLEEHLRKWSERVEMLLKKARPTLDDFNQALYKSNHIDKLTMKQVEAMAAIGNACAHSQSFTDEQVKGFLRDVREFLVHHPCT